MTSGLTPRAVARWSATYLRNGWGYAFYALWTLALTDEFDMFGTSSPLETAGAARLASMLAIALAGILTCVFAHRLTCLRSRKRLMLGVGLVGSAGMVLRPLAATGVLPGFWELPALVLCGFASGFVVAAWLEHFMAQGLHCVVWSYFACMLAGAAAACVLVALPRPVAWVVLGIAPLASVVGLTRTPRSGNAPAPSALEDPVALSGNSGAPTGGRTVMYVLVVVGLSCLAAQLLRLQETASAVVLPRYAPVLVSLLPTAAAAVVASVVATYAYVFRTSIVFQACISVVTVAGLLLMFNAMGPGGAALAVSAASMCDHLIASLAICLFFDLACDAHVRLRCIGALVAVQMVGTSAAVGVTFVASDSVFLNAVVLTCMIAMALVVMGDIQGFAMKSYAREIGPAEAAGPTIADRINEIASRCGLTAREREILQIWGTGHTSAYIEDRLGITRNTVRTHLNHIYEKTGAATKEQLLQLIEERDVPGAAGVRCTVPEAGDLMSSGIAR